jgi:beta-lactamase regulating signal transducer with metallopeptidase domain
MMNTLTSILVAAGSSLELSVVVKATIAVMLGLLAVRIARRARASVRHLILASTFVALLLLPVAAILAPGIAIVVPVSGTSQSARSGSQVVPPTDPAAFPTSGANALPAAPRWTLQEFSAVARAGWAAGAAALLAWLAVDVWRFSRLRRNGLPWPESRPTIAALMESTGIQRQVDVLFHEGLSAPATCGWHHPAVLVPADAAEWSDTDLRRALVHELEHVRRGDWAFQLLARATCAAFWFHPLVWAAFRRLRLEAERACDDAVLQNGDDADYAAQLVQLARRMSDAPAQPSLAMAARSDLSARVSAILDGRQSRGRHGLAPTLLALVVAGVLVGAIAPLRAVAVRTGPVAAAAAQGSAQRPSRRVVALDKSLYEAAEDADLDGIAELIAAGANVNASISGDGSPLIGAARSGSIDAVRLLLDRGADPNMIVRGDGSPLIAAATGGHADIVDLLLTRGANIDQVAPGDENALIQASGGGQLGVVMLLVTRGANVNARVWSDSSWDARGVRRPDGEWRTPVSEAQQSGHDAVVAYLISAGARE